MCLALWLTEGVGTSSDPVILHECEMKSQKMYRKSSATLSISVFWSQRRRCATKSLHLNAVASCSNNLIPLWTQHRRDRLLSPVRNCHSTHLCMFSQAVIDHLEHGMHYEGWILLCLFFKMASKYKYKNKHLLKQPRFYVFDRMLSMHSCRRSQQSDWEL